MSDVGCAMPPPARPIAPERLAPIAHLPAETSATRSGRIMIGSRFAGRFPLGVGESRAAIGALSPRTLPLGRRDGAHARARRWRSPSPAMSGSPRPAVGASRRRGRRDPSPHPQGRLSGLSAAASAPPEPGPRAARGARGAADGSGAPSRGEACQERRVGKRESLFRASRGAPCISACGSAPVPGRTLSTAKPSGRSSESAPARGKTAALRRSEGPALSSSVCCATTRSRR